MCGRYANSASTAELIDEFAVQDAFDDDLPPSWNIAPTDPVRIITYRQSHHADDAGPVRQLRTVRWGPRTLDLDLLLYDQLVLDGSRLILPHPRLHQRAFVVYPLYDIAPDLEIPGQGLLSELLKKFPQPALVRLDSAE